jgi:uncharacterized protein
MSYEFLDSCQPLEIKADSTTGDFEGYASTFNNRDLQGDIVRPGAFTATLKANRGLVPVFMAHLPFRQVGWGTEASEDSKGLKVRGQFTLASDEGRNAHALVIHGLQVGQKPGLSIGYRVQKNGATYNEATDTRELTGIDLYEYSIAAIPANPRARISSAKDFQTLRQVERFLRAVGLDDDEARHLIHVIKASEWDATRPSGNGDASERDAKELRALIAGARADIGARQILESMQWLKRTF